MITILVLIEDRRVAVEARIVDGIAWARVQVIQGTATVVDSIDQRMSPKKSFIVVAVIATATSFKAVEEAQVVQREEITTS